MQKNPIQIVLTAGSSFSHFPNIRVDRRPIVKSETHINATGPTTLIQAHTPPHTLTTQYNSKKSTLIKITITTTLTWLKVKQPNKTKEQRKIFKIDKKYLMF